MPSRPASLARKERARKRREPPTPPLRRRLARILLRPLLILLLAPPVLLLAFSFLPVPITPLMVIRLIEGEGLQKRWVPLEEIAPALAEAVVAGEDNLFCQHWGFDWQSLLGEIDSHLAGESARGASTITMQTAKNLFLWPGRSVVRKAFEAWLTPQIELLWPKQRIIEVYLNLAELGPGIYGAEAAAEAAFDKPARSLSSYEAALLAAVLPNPRAWSAARPTPYIERRAATLRSRIEQLGPMLDCVRAR
jgi:monofunctional biosynthetic peptidoglycan transglycosylase